MAKEEENPKRSELREKLMEIFKRLKDKHKLVPEKLEPLINESHHTLSKYKIGKIPKRDLKKPEEILIKLENLERELEANKPPVLYKYSQKRKDLADKPVKYITANGNQRIYLPFHMKVVPDHDNLKVTGYPTEVGGIDVIIAYPNDTAEFQGAEGQIPLYDAAAGNLNGCRIAIARIQVKDCVWGTGYYIIDKSHQTYLRRIYQESNGQYRLESLSPQNHPYKLLHENDILVVFRVIGFLIKSQPAIFQSFISS